MTTNTKKIVNVKVLRLDETGYGPKGKHTRRQWRAECLENLLAGQAQFLAWQESWRLDIDASLVARFDNISCLQDVKHQSLYPHIDSAYLLDFSGVVFNNHANFVDYHFLHPVSFHSAQFSDYTQFDGAFFGEYVTFYRASFRHNVSFDLTRFCRKASFCVAQFDRYVGFKCAQFSGDASFNRSKFGNNAWFESVEFGGEAHYDGAQFGMDASFYVARFNGYARFNGTRFHGYVRFDAASFAGLTDFQQALFKQSSAFENAVFKMVGHFERARFGKIPNFLGVDIASTSLQLPDDLHFTQAVSDDESINQISFLKRLSDEHGQWEQALNFNAMELRARRKRAWKALFKQQDLQEDLQEYYQKDGFWFCVFTWAYEAVADFGRSFTRPLKWLILLMLASWIFAIVAANETDPCKAENNCAPIFAQLATTPKYKDSEGKEMLQLSAYRAAAEYGVFRFANFADFTDKDKNTEAITMRLFNQLIEPWWARLFGLFKGLTGTVLLFLIGLGLRNRYRVG